MDDNFGPWVGSIFSFATRQTAGWRVLRLLAERKLVRKLRSHKARIIITEAFEPAGLKGNEYQPDA
jgi:hypothetical protein